MFESILNNPIFLLVTNGFKTGGVFHLPKEIALSKQHKKNLLDMVQNNYPQIIAYFHPVNNSFFEFTHKELYKIMIKEYYPNWIEIDPLIIINKRKELFNEKNPYEVYYGRFFDIPQKCREDFQKSFNDPKIKSKFIYGLDQNISLAYNSKEGLKEAKQYIKNLNNLLKKCTTI